MKIIVIGAGNWGTTLACLFARNNQVSLWCHRPEDVAAIATTRENARYLPGVRLPEGVCPAMAFSEPVAPDDIIIMAVPSRVVPEVAAQLGPLLAGQPVVCAAKGFQHSTLRTMGEVIAEALPASPLIVLSGPNIARELAEGKPTKAVLASENLAAVARVARTFKNELLAFEISRDVKGVELCAALKGIIAIGVGVADGLELGDNFTALLMTYGLREFVAVAEFLGINHKTIYGIAGMGDLIASCLSPNSRNRRFGRLLGQDVGRDEALGQVGMVVEGVQMAKTIVELGDLNITIPLFTAITELIFGTHKSTRRELLVNCLLHYRG